MNLIQKVEHWGDAHHPRWIDTLRIILGVIIFAKGVSFIADTNSILTLMESSNFPLSKLTAIHYIAFAHLVGGIFITLGLVTRIAIAFQLPVLFGAVFFVNITNGFSFLNSELWLSIVVLFLLILFFIIGSGTYSLDYVMKRPGYKRWF